MSAPEPYWKDERVRLYVGDCVEMLAEMDTGSVDAVCTDPPYGLEFMGKEWDGANGFRRSLNPADAERNNVFGRTSCTSPEYRDRFSGAVTDRDFKGFVLSQQRTRNVKCPDCGKWAYDHPGHLCECGGVRRAQVSVYQTWCEAWARECLRVLKPGGHLLAFGGTRTYHRLVCAIEDAGFEIRDSLHWIYGSGFPKSLDVGKAIDKAGPPGRRIRYPDFGRYYAEKRSATGLSHAEVCAAIGAHGEINHGGASSNWETGLTLPTVAQWNALTTLLGISGDRSEWPMAMKKEYEREVIGQRLVNAGVAFTSDGPRELDITAPATEDATRWEGWGTALKPAHEPIILARKPLVRSVAANVLQHGTGALNIDGCRVEGGSRPARSNEVSASGLTGMGGAATYGSFAVCGSIATGTTDAGRWPPNVLLGPEAAAELDRQSGVLTSGANPERRGSDKFRDAYGDFTGQQECTPHRGADSGGASRFFPVFRYEAKAGSSERPRLEDGTAHPTVKPVDLMCWLVRLVTPPDGLVLDPFAGTGTTAEACLIEGFRCVLIEKDPAYAELIRKRLDKPIQPVLFSGEASA